MNLWTLLMVDSDKDALDGGQPTRAGCLLAAVSAALMLAAAVPIVSWRDAETGRPLPRMIAIVAAACVGAICYGIGAAALRMFGLAVWTTPKHDGDETPDDEGAALDSAATPCDHDRKLR